ncbi:MAG TPA: tRNA uridine(34) 5-carboxymethylaminomethyl modification radical SAM/GNAT enzyme Elp3, partial [Patescibacteria group bacterium]|nr:tRNA uridine(34) 5-carboxymethylaminomethyl modification radical SAM/GNAT enzyme Elp3 [Patescibacteria group bacterium]
MFQAILLKIIEQKPIDRKSFLRAKKNAAAFFSMAPPKNQDLITAYRELRSEHKIEKNHLIEKSLKKRTVRTASGIACVTVMTKQYRCPGRCIFCPQVAGMPKSYLPDQPAMMRAIRNEFDPFGQVSSRIVALQNNGHATDKIEIRIAGETWSAYPKRYQTWFIKRIFDALNNETSRGIVQAQQKNETAANRC